jgi:hypothetical protein
MSGHTYHQPDDPAIVGLLDRADSYQLATVARYGEFRTDVWELKPHEQSARGCR